MNYEHDKSWAQVKREMERQNRQDMIAVNCILIALGSGVIYLLWEILK